MGTCLSVLFLILAGPGLRRGSAEILSPSQEARLFSLATLGAVDLSPKRVMVEIYADPHPEVAPFKTLFPQAWSLVEAFYAKMGVLLEMVPGQAAPGNLAPAKRLRIEVLSHKEWLERTFTAFQVEPPFRLKFQAVCQDKYAFAHLNLSTIHLDFKHYQRDILSQRAREAGYNPQKLANLIIHEIGHLLGLYHAHEFVNDRIPEMLPDGKTPNFMSHYLTQPRPLGFVDFQKRLVHSYLSGGKVFQQHLHADFDPLRYLELLKQYNNYREPR